MNRKTMWVWVLAIVSAIGVEAAAAKFNSKLMDRDLRIMERILGEILGHRTIRYDLEHVMEHLCDLFESKPNGQEAST